MVRCKNEIEIAAAPEQVFALIADPTNLPKYTEVCTAVRGASGMASVGSVYVIEGEVKGRSGEITHTVVDCQPPRRFVTTFEGPRGTGRVTTTITSRGTGSLLSQRVEHTLKPEVRNMVPGFVIAKYLGDGQRRLLERVKGLLEAEGGAPSTSSKSISTVL